MSSGGGASAAGPMVASTMATWRWRRHARLSAVPATALVVASNCPSGYFGPEVHDAYYGHPSGMGWLAPLMFADGAGAVVFRSAPQDPGGRPKGLLSVRYE